MSNNPSDLVFQEDLVPAGFELTDEEWEAHIKEIIKIGEEEDVGNGRNDQSNNIDMSWSIVFVRMDKEIYHEGPRQLPTNILHVSNPGTYAAVPEGTSSNNTEVDTILPTEDEDEIKRWKLVPCSAQLQFSNSWVRFRCKLFESEGHPENFEVVAKSENVLDCKVYRMANDDRGNRLLWINMKAKRFGNPIPVELCCKKIVGQEVTRLSDDESDYVCQEECGRFWEEPYTGV